MSNIEYQPKVLVVESRSRKQSEIYVVSRYSLSGQLLESYPNARIAAEMMNTAQQHISRAARENTNLWTACGYIWRRGKATQIDLRQLLKAKWYSASPLARQQYTVGQYDLEGNLVKMYTNTIEAGKAVGIHYKGIRDVIKGRGLTYGGFIWRRSVKKNIAVDPKITEKIAPVSQYDLEGRWIRSYKNCWVAAKETQIDNGQIHHVLHGKLLTAGGYLWRKGQQLRINVNQLRDHRHYSGSKLDKHLQMKRKIAQTGKSL